jgi:hypothetical protein
MRTTEEMLAALDECDHHAEILRQARTEMNGTRFSSESAQNISGDKLRLLDQLAYRFGKLQDTLGLRVLPGILDLSEEPLPESAPFAQKLQLLERLGVILSVEQWRTLRELRNQLAHEYVDAPAFKAAALNRFIDGVDGLLDIWEHLSDYVDSIGLRRT